jgi:hypothetical protein
MEISLHYFIRTKSQTIQTSEQESDKISLCEYPVRLFCNLFELRVLLRCFSESYLEKLKGFFVNLNR